MALDPTLSLRVEAPQFVAPDVMKAKEEAMGLRAKQLAQAGKELEITGQLLSSAVDQPSYDAARQKAQALGLDVANVPPVFDPNYVKQTQMAVLDMSDRIKLELSQAESTLKQDLLRAKVGTEQAQAGSFNALANQRNAAAGSFAALEDQRRTPEPSAGPAAPAPGDRILLPPPVEGGNSPPMDIPNPTSKVYSNKPIPQQALKQQNEALDIIGTANNINADLKSIDDTLGVGKLELGIFSNLANKGKNMAGISDPASRQFATFQATLQKLRNDSLRLNKGVQTEGDAVRAWNELLENINDTQLVKKRLKEIQTINQRAADLQKANVDNIRKNYNVEPVDYSRYEGKSSVQNEFNDDYSKMSDDEIRKSLGL